MLPEERQSAEEGYRPFAGLPKLERAANDVEERDRDLFLAAIGRIRPPKRAPSGFALEAACPSWQTAFARKDKRDKAQNGIAENDKRSKMASKKLKRGTPAVPPVVPSADFPAEVALEDEFMAAMRNVTPLAARGRAVARRPEPARQTLAASPSFEERVDQSMEFALFSSEEYLEGHVLGLDEQLVNRLREGHFSPEAHLDLHGLTAAQAFEALREFMRQAWYKGMRCVLLVPGRGRNSPQGMGILRSKLQSWLTQEPFKRIVLAFCTAKPHDGGAGGIYALLRRSRKKGRIQWECLPSDADLYQQ